MNDPAFTDPDLVSKLGDIWSDVIGLPVKADDDFFALGGDSIAATHIMGRATEVFGLELPVQMIFEAAMLQDLAADIMDLQKKRMANTSAVANPADQK